MNQKLNLHIKGEQHNWVFPFSGDPKYLEEWRADGLEIHEVYYTVPKWIDNIGFTRFWCFFQDMFYFRNPFKK